MENETRPGVPAQVEEPPADAAPSGPPSDRPGAAPGPAEEADVAGPSPPVRWPAARAVRAVLVACCLGVLVAATRYAFPRTGGAEGEAAPNTAALSVNTAFPRQKTLVRTLVQSGSVLPYAQVELYVKTSGYLQSIRRDVTPQVVAAVVTQPLTAALNGPPAGYAAVAATSTNLALRQAPPADIGSAVAAGDLLLKVDVPEQQQDVVEKEAVVRQREEELAQAKTVVETFRASVEVARAQKAQAESDVRRYRAEHTLRVKELGRVRDLIRGSSLEARLGDEKEAQVEAALSAWESSQAKVQTAQADLALASAKLDAARGDIRVKEAQVTVARADLRRARILVDYGRLHAPFDGIITYRGVDEGDFIQNAQSGQSRHLMTVTALDKVKVQLQVPSQDAVWVRVGADAVMEVDSRPGERFVGRVSRVRRVLDAQARTMQVEVDLDNRDQRLMPGMYGNMTLTLRKLPNAWVIPAAALYSRNRVNYIIQVQGGVAVRHPVRIRFDGGSELVVVKLVGGKEVPLDGSEELVVSGKGEIADGQRVSPPRTPAE